MTRAQEASRSFDILTAASVTVFGDVYEPANVKRPPLLLAFHQGGGDARGEYTPIIPRLLAEGYAVMTIDQRQCGGVFEGVNRTVEALPDGVEYGFCDAYPDLEAALSYAHTARVKVGLTFNRALSLSSFVQYSSDADLALGNFRLRYNPREGNDLYVVFNEGLNLDRFDRTPVPPFVNARTLVMKYSYTFVR